MIEAARPGEVVARGPGFTWIAYQMSDGAIVAACYVLGRLLQRDAAGWYVANFYGERVRLVNGDPVELLKGTHPTGLPVAWWQEDLREETRHEQPRELRLEGSWL